MFNLLFTLALMTSPQAKPATNTLCPVLGSPVTAKSQVVLFQGQEYRICCPGCEAKLTSKPGDYLEKDGTPKNAPKAKAAKSKYSG